MNGDVNQPPFIGDASNPPFVGIIDNPGLHGEMGMGLRCGVSHTPLPSDMETPPARWCGVMDNPPTRCCGDIPTIPARSCGSVEHPAAGDFPFPPFGIMHTDAVGEIETDLCGDYPMPGISHTDAIGDLSDPPLM